MRTDEQLVGDYLNGDEAAFDELTRRYLKPIYNFLRRLVSDAAEAEDATQDAFLNAWRHLRRFDRKRSFRSWLYRIARNAAYDRLKKKKPQPFAAFADEAGGNVLIDQLADPAPLADEIFANAHLAARLEAALNRLSPPFREVLILHYHDSLTFREIGEILGEPLDTVKSRHQRGLVKLKNLLEERA